MSIDGIDRHSAQRLRETDILVSRNLRAYRTIAGLTQAEASEALGLSAHQFHKYETGINRIPAGRLYLAAKVLGVPIGAFYEPRPEFNTLTAEFVRHCAKLTPVEGKAVAAAMGALAG